MSLIQQEELRTAIRAAISSAVRDVADIEVQAFLSSLRSSFGLAAAHRALATDKEITTDDPDTFESTNGFNFQELPKSDLIRELDASTGLGRPACLTALNAVESFVLDRLQSERELEVEPLGRFYITDRHRLRFHLEDDLQVGRDAKSLRITPSSV